MDDILEQIRENAVRDISAACDEQFLNYIYPFRPYKTALQWLLDENSQG